VDRLVRLLDGRGDLDEAKVLQRRNVGLLVARISDGEIDVDHIFGTQTLDRS